MNMELAEMQAGISTDTFLTHWQSHRNLTRRVISAFPEKDLFNFSIGGMRPFAEMVMELITIAEGSMTGILTGKWNSFDEYPHNTDMLVNKSKDEILKKWDYVTEHINAIWPQFTPEDFNRVDLAFKAYENTNIKTLQYAIDNELHHRGQAYVYLRALNIEPPFFWEH